MSDAYPLVCELDFARACRSFVAYLRAKRNLKEIEERGLKLDPWFSEISADSCKKRSLALSRMVEPSRLEWPDIHGCEDIEELTYGDDGPYDFGDGDIPF